MIVSSSVVNVFLHLCDCLILELTNYWQITVPLVVLLKHDYVAHLPWSNICFYFPFSLGTEGSDTALAAVLESLEFCLKLRGSEASILEDLSKAINLVRVRRDLVENDRVLLNHAHRVQQEYER